MTQLLRLYTLTHAVTSRLGAEEAAAWFQAGHPAPLDRLIAGDIDAVERAAHGILFDRPPDRYRSYAAFAPDDDEELPIPRATVPLRRAHTAPRIGKLPRRNVRD